MTWTKTALSDVTDLLTDGTHYTPPDVGSGIPFLTVKDVSERGLDFEGCSKITSQEFEAAKRQNSVPQLGDILFSKDGTVGKVHLVRERQDFAVLSSLAILRPSSNVESGYLAHFLRWPATIEAAARKKTGSAIRRIVLRDLSTIEVPLPPLDEQRRIAAILDKADGLRRNRKRSLDLLDMLPQSMFLEISKGIHKKGAPISQFARVQGGKRLPKGHAYHAHETGYKYLRVIDIQNDRLRRTDLKNLSEELFKAISRYVVKEGDVVISIAGTIGVTRYIDLELSGVNLTENAAKIVLHEHSKVDPIYLTHALRSEELQNQVRASTGQVTIGKLALFRIESLEVPLPPLEEQLCFRRQVAKVGAVREALTIAANSSEDAFSSLQHRAFSGKL